MTINTVLIDRIISQAEQENPNMTARRWSDEENRFIIENYQSMTDDDMGAILDRTPVAVHLHIKRDMGLPARSKYPEYITAERAADALGIDQHKMSGWINAGMISRIDVPAVPKIQIMRVLDFMVWAVSPRSWIYFDISGVKDPHLKRLIDLRIKRWGDEWWTNRQVADYWGVDVKDVLNYIKRKRIPAIQSEHSIGGRHHNRYWKSWFVLRSDAINTKIWSKHHDMKHVLDMQFTPAADAFLVRAIEELGCCTTIVAKMMKKKQSTVGRRYHQISDNQLPYHPSKRINK